MLTEQTLPETEKLNRRFFVTFGPKYAQEEHPTLPEAHPSGYATIYAPDMESARKIAFDKLGPAFAFLYAEDNFDPDLYPYGSIATL